VRTGLEECADDEDDVGEEEDTLPPPCVGERTRAQAAQEGAEGRCARDGLLLEGGELCTEVGADHHAWVSCVR
jgi:hypothetical protein